MQTQFKDNMVIWHNKLKRQAQQLTNPIRTHLTVAKKHTVNKNTIKQHYDFYLCSFAMCNVNQLRL